MFSSRAAMMRARASALPFKVCASRVCLPSRKRSFMRFAWKVSKFETELTSSQRCCPALHAKQIILKLGAFAIERHIRGVREAPLGTLYAASLMREHGYSVALFDAMLAESEADWSRALEREQPRFAILYEDRLTELTNQ